MLGLGICVWARVARAHLPGRSRCPAGSSPPARPCFGLALGVRSGGGFGPPPPLVGELSHLGGGGQAVGKGSGFSAVSSCASVRGAAGGRRRGQGRCGGSWVCPPVQRPKRHRPRHTGRPRFHPRAGAKPSGDPPARHSLPIPHRRQGNTGRRQGVHPLIPAPARAEKSPRLVLSDVARQTEKGLSRLAGRRAVGRGFSTPPCPRGAGSPPQRGAPPPDGRGTARPRPHCGHTAPQRRPSPR